jgi:hypothetical protein
MSILVKKKNTDVEKLIERLSGIIRNDRQKREDERGKKEGKRGDEGLGAHG